MKTYTHLRRTVFCVIIAVMLCCYPSEAAEKEEKESPVFGELNQKVPGEFSGQMQLLIMRRNYDHHDASSGTVATTLAYHSPDSYPVRMGLMYIHAAKLFAGGSYDVTPPDDGAYQVFNDRFSILQEAYLEFALDDIGLDGSTISVGRRISDYDFAPTLAIRQKPQGLEGVFMHLGQWDNLSIDLGHIERFSSWSTRHTGSDYLRYEYKPIEDVVAAQDPGVSETPGSTSGMQFINLKADLMPGLSLTAYDLYGRNLYNTFGVKVQTLLAETDAATFTWNNHYIQQNDVGDYDDYLGSSLDASAWESSLPITMGNFMIEPGIFTVMSDDAIRHPMELSFTGTYTLDWFTRPYEGNSDSFFLKSTYTFGDTVLYGLWYGTDHDSSVGNGAFDQEIDFVIKHNFTPNLSAAIKAGFGHQDNRGGIGDSNREDMRLFLTYKF